MALTDLRLPKKASVTWQGMKGQALSVLTRVFSRTGELMPKGLYVRTLIIIIAPIVLLEGVVAFVFMERHWQAVTRRLSEATARDVAAVMQLYQMDSGKNNYAELRTLASKHLNLSLQVLPAGDLPPRQPKPFFALLDRTLSNEIRKRIGETPFWIDTVGNSRHVEIKIKLQDNILRFIARRSQTYASNSHIFLLWMVLTSIILLSVAILFLRNQIKPILRLAEAANNFGKGRPIPEDLTPRGAREVREAATAFIEMRDRITQHVEQRTAMLAAVSHDLRTVLTRLKLELALLDETSESKAMQHDVNEMQHMLEEYLAFAKGDDGEAVKPTRLNDILDEVVLAARIHDTNISIKQNKKRRQLIVPLKRHAFKRALTNLVSNAGRFAQNVVIRVSKTRKSLFVIVEDDGPGIPQEEYENVFRPFYRLDHARNQDVGNSGLGLAITRDIARSHGGDVSLSVSPLGGLQATMRIPL